MDSVTTVCLPSCVGRTSINHAWTFYGHPNFENFLLPCYGPVTVILWHGKARDTLLTPYGMTQIAHKMMKHFMLFEDIVSWRPQHTIVSSLPCMLAFCTV